MAVFDILPQTNLSGNDIRDTLASGGGSVSNSASSWFNPEAKINMWSLAKPNFMIGDEIIPDTEKNRSGALLIPSYAPLDVNELGILNHSIWTYPRIYNTKRMGDFRGYNKNAFPPIIGLTVTPQSNTSSSNVTMGDKLKFVYNPAGFNPRNVYFNCAALSDLFLGVIVTSTKGTGTSGDGSPFPWDFTNQYNIVKIEDYPFYNSQQGAIENNFTEVELRETGNIKVGSKIACLLCLFSTKNPATARVTSMLIPATDPNDIFIADTIHTFNIVG